MGKKATWGHELMKAVAPFPVAEIVQDILDSDEEGWMDKIKEGVTKKGIVNSAMSSFGARTWENRNYEPDLPSANR